MSEAAKSGKVYLAGAGPGDPGLLTVKATHALAAADVVLYDRLVGPEILALANPSAELVYVGKQEGEQHVMQERIFQLLLEYALQGKTVVRLKGGDPLVFGRGAEEWALLQEKGIEVELIPGVSSAMAVPGLAGIPLTYRNISQSFAVVTGHCREGLEQEWTKFASVDTLVVLMGVKNRAFIAQALINAGRDPRQPVAFIERGTTAHERIVESDLASVAAGKLDVENPAIFIIGEVVWLRSSLKAILEDVVST